MKVKELMHKLSNLDGNLELQIHIVDANELDWFMFVTKVTSDYDTAMLDVSTDGFVVNIDEV